MDERSAERIAFTTESVTRERFSGDKAVSGGEESGGAEVYGDSWARSTQDGSHSESLLPF